jgi:predicted peroxiredoxin
MDKAEWEAFAASGPSTVILINNDGMGSAEKALRQKLLHVYLTMLLENGLHPGTICFYGDGVKMAVDGSPVIDLLKELESSGVRLIVCNTCLKYFGLTEKVAAGTAGNMSDIVLAQGKATKVITL